MLILKSLILGSYLTFILNMIFNGSLKFQICGNTLLIISWNKGLYINLGWRVYNGSPWNNRIRDKTLTKIIGNIVKLIGVYEQMGHNREKRISASSYEDVASMGLGLTLQTNKQLFTKWGERKYIITWYISKVIEYYLKVDFDELKKHNVNHIVTTN